MRALVFLVLFLLSGWAGFAQRFSFMHRGAEDGLPATVINDLELDQNGTIWLATSGGGIFLFSGTDFSPFYLQQKLPSPFVTVVKRAPNGDFWIGTEQGIARFDGVRITNIADRKLSKINAITFHKNQVYVAAREGLFAYEDGHLNQDTTFGKGEIVAVASVGEKLFVGTKSRVFVKENNRVSQFWAKPANRLIAVEGGLVSCFADLAECTFSDTSFTVFHMGIRDAFREANNTLWLASQRQGLLRIANNRVQVIDDDNGLAYSRLRCLLFVDDKLWLGSQQGLGFLPNPAYFAIDASQGLADESVHAALTWKNSFWLGTASGVSAYSRATNTVTNFNQTHGLPEGLVLDLALFKNQLWAASENGIAIFKNGSFAPVFTQNGSALKFVFCIQPYADKMFVGTAAGAYKFQNNAFVEVAFADGNTEGIAQIVVRQNHLNFVGISGKVFELKDNALVRVKKWHTVALDTLPVFALAANQSNEALFINGHGIYIFAYGKVHFVNQNNGLTNVNFKSAKFVGNRLWFTTDDGMQFIDLAHNNRIELRKASSFLTISGRDFNSRSLRVTAGGELLNGTNNGLLVLANNSVKTHTTYGVGVQRVKLFFKEDTTYQAFAKGVEPWSLLPQKLALPYSKNYLSFTFNLPASLVHNANVKIRYKLIGQDENWTEAGNRREAFFTNIQPGNYTFAVQSSMDGDFSNAQTAKFSFKIIAPFWLMWWFWVLVALVVGGIVFAIMRFRIVQLNQKLKLETALANSERKALRLQMNPHFVFNALDAISGFIYKNDAKAAVQYLGNFAKLMRLTLESSREMWVPLQNELQLLKNYMALEQLRFNNKFLFAIELSEDVDPYDVQLPPMLLQPFVENAIIHGLKHKPDNNGKLTVAFAKTDKFLCCTITDNGVGRKRSAEINAKRNKKSLATSITQERIDLLEKSIGERVTFTIEDLQLPTGEAAGTRVKITFPYHMAEF